MRKIFVSIFLILLGIIIAGCQSSITGKAVSSEVKEINVDAFKFGYTPNVLEVQKGERVRIVVNNKDVPHGIVIPQLNLRGENELEFTAEQKGEFEWYCMIPCGSGHKTMRGKIIVG